MTSTDTCGATEGEKESYEDRFVRHVTLPSLQTISSFQVALSVFYSYISNSKCIYAKSRNGKYDCVANAFNLNDGYKSDCYHTIEHLKSPRSIEVLLKERLDNVIEEIRKWISHMNTTSRARNSFNFFHLNIRTFDVNSFAWLPNGKIDYKGSAKKMSRGSDFNARQKFLLMCEYCLEDEMKTFSFSSLNPNQIDLLNFEDDYLVFYWVCYLKNELDKIPIEDHDSLDIFMATKCDLGRWSAFEYFWNRSSTSGQFLIANNWLTYPSKEKPSAQDRILSMMSGYQQREILLAIPEKIIFNFFFISNSPESAIWAWNRSKDTITDHRFVNLLNSLENHLETEAFLLLVWDSIPDRLKDHAVQYIEKRFHVLFRMLRPTATEFALLCKYFPLKSEDFWKYLLLTNVFSLANHAEDPRPMIELIELCFPDPEELSKYKKSLIDHESMRFSCLRLFGSGNLENVDLKLKFCSTDLKAAREYKKDLLMQTRVFEKGIYFTDIEKWNKLSDFIDDAFADDPSLALTKKKRYISIYADAWPNKNDHTGDERIDDLMKIVEMMFADEELRMIKKAFVRSFLKLRKNRNSLWREKFTCKKLFHKFVASWCLSKDEKEIGEFKNSLPIGVIFKEIFSKLERGYARCSLISVSLLDDLDYFLKWYLGDDEDVRMYKLTKLAGSDGLKIFETVSHRSDRLALEALVKWGFEGDGKLAFRTIKSGTVKSTMKHFGIFKSS